MLEQKLQQMGMSMAIGVFTDVYGTMPSLIDFLDRVAKYKFYDSVLAKNIDHEGNVALLSCDQNVVTQIRDALISQNVPFTIVGSDAFHAELRRFRKSEDKDSPNPPLPTSDEISRNEHIDTLISDFEKKGAYTFFLPTSFATTVLSQREIEGYLSLNETRNGFQNLRPEDSIMLPPARGCTLLDIILANAFVEELREEYGITIDENTQDIEKEVPEQEDLEREIGDGSDRNQGTIEDTPHDQISAQERMTPDTAGEPANSKEKKQRKNNTGRSKYSDTRDLRAADSYSQDIEEYSSDSTKDNYIYKKTQEAHSDETSRVGDMSINGNLAHDSFKRQEEINRKEQEDANQDQKSHNPQTQTEPNAKISDRKSENVSENNTAKQDDPYTSKTQKENSSKADENRTNQSVNFSRSPETNIEEKQPQKVDKEKKQEVRRTQARDSSLERNEKSSNTLHQYGHNHDEELHKTEFNPYEDFKNGTKKQNETKSRNDTRTGGMSVSNNRAHDSFKNSHETKIAHFDDYQKTVLEYRSGGNLSGNSNPQAKYQTNPYNINAEGYIPPIKPISGKREILFDNHASQNGATWTDAIKSMAVEHRAKHGTALTRPVKEAIKEAVTGDGTEGGDEGKKYLRNTAPVTRFLARESKYATSIAAAQEITHDGDAWVKAYAATRGEPNTANAEAFVEATLKNAGIDAKDLDGKNIFEVRDALKQTSTTKATISRMSNEAMQDWKSKNVANLPERLEDRINDYRCQLDRLNNLQKPGTANKEMLSEYRQAKAKLEKEAQKSLRSLTAAAAGARTTMQQLKDEIDKLHGGIKTFLSQANNMVELTELLKSAGYSDAVIKEIQTISFDALKNSDAIELIKKKFDYEGLLKKISSTKELQMLVFEGKISSISELVSKMDTAAFGAFLKSCGMSQSMIDQVIKLGKDRITLNPDILHSLIKKTSGSDKILLEKVQGMLGLEKTQTGSYKGLATGITKKILQNAFGNSEGANFLWETTEYLGNARRITSTGIKISMKASNRFLGSDAAITRGLNAVAHPAKFVIEKLTKTAAGQAIANSKAVMKTSKFLGRAHHFAHAPGRFVGKTSRAAAKGIGKAISTGAKNVAVAVGKLLGLNTAAAGGTVAAAGGTIVGGWVVLAIVAVVMILVALAESSSSSTGNDTSGNYQLTQFDTDFQTEILNELQNLNDSFEETVNRAATDRTFWSSENGFSETDSVTFYENGAYSVYFRDEEGNELDHLDINNSKAILDMATQYCKYADWVKPSENTSEDTKLAYEQIKQYYLDYCKFLWVSTHRITLEEYRPGDESHAKDDQSGLTTDAQGICPKDGTRVWLQKNFTPGAKTGSDGTKYICGVNNGGAASPGVCNRLDQTPFDNVYSDYGDYAICTHPKEGLTSGWSIVTDENQNPITQDHYICIKGHACNHGTHDDPDYEYHHCGDYCDKRDEYVYYDSCKHTDYQWEYHCGGHMGAVIYVTVGDVSRLKDIDPAKDIDINDLSNYPENSNDSYIQDTGAEALTETAEAIEEN